MVGLIAGGDRALRHSVEGAEETTPTRAKDMRALGL
jgi:N-acetylmuramic acid 6-phosphate (MurNAc-6-P) etherase